MKKLKLFCWKTIDKNFVYGEIKIADTKYERAEAKANKICVGRNITPLMYEGWEEIVYD